MLEERDASAKVLARWVPLGLAVAHAVRCMPRSGTDVQGLPIGATQIDSDTTTTHRVSTQRERRGTVRKWATTNFDSGEVIAAAGPSTLNSGSESGGTTPRETDSGDTKPREVARTRHEDSASELAILEVD